MQYSGCSIQGAVFRLQYSVCSKECAEYIVKSLAWSVYCSVFSVVQHVVCSLLSAVCSVQFAASSVLCELCSVQCAVCSVLHCHGHLFLPRSSLVVEASLSKRQLSIIWTLSWAQQSSSTQLTVPTNGSQVSPS